MNQQQVEAWIAQNGGAGRVQYSQSTKEVDNPAADPITAKAAGVPFSATAPAKITITEEKWTSVDDQGKPTGAELHVRRRPDGDFDVVNQANPNPTRPGNDPNSPTTQQAQAQAQTAQAQAQSEQELNRERQWNSQNGYGWVTHAQRAEAVRQQEAQARDDKNQERLTAAQEASNQLARDRLQFDKDKANLPTVKADDVVVNGQHYTRVTSLSPQGTATITNYGPDGKPVGEIPQEGKTPLPKDLPQFTFNWLHPDGDGGFDQWAAMIRARPDMTDKAKADLITSRHNAVNSMLARSQAILQAQENTRSSQVTQRGQDMTQANARLSQAGTDFANAQKATADATKYATGDVSGVMPYYMALAHAAGQAYGGFANSPQVQGGPAIQQVGSMGIPGQGLAGMLPLPTGAPPAVAQGVSATNAAAANPTGANVQAATDATMQGSNAAFGALGINPQNDALRGTSLGSIGPSTLFPTPKPSGLGAMMQPTSDPSQQQPFQPSGAGAMLMSRANGYDPTGLNQQLLAAGLDPSVIQALGGVG